MLRILKRSFWMMICRGKLIEEKSKWKISNKKTQLYKIKNPHNYKNSNTKNPTPISKKNNRTSTTFSNWPNYNLNLTSKTTEMNT